MNYLNKTWVKILISFLGGGMVQEIIHISTGDPNRVMTTNLSLVYGVIIFIGLTVFINWYKKGNNEERKQ